MKRNAQVIQRGRVICNLDCIRQFTVGVGAYAFYDTAQVAVRAIGLFEGRGSAR